MKKFDIVVAASGVLLVVLAVVYFQRPQSGPELPPVSRVQPPPEQAAEPAIRYPIAASPPVEARPPATQPAAPAPPAETAAPAAPQPEPLPALVSSDVPLQAALDSVLTVQSYKPLFYSDGLIRRLVVSIDNLPGRQFPRSNYRLARPTPGLLVVETEKAGPDERLYLSPENSARYTRLATVINGLDSAGLVAIYRRFYPLFQQEYENLGYPPSAYFNDRLVDVIDHLLATPDVTGRIELVRPHVLYRYADPELEKLSAGQKVLLRIGPDKARVLKTKLREIRQMLVGKAKAGQGLD